MSEQKGFLKKIHLKNYRSLRNVTLPLKPLTVLVGPNASGKTNTLNALRLFNSILRIEVPPTSLGFIRERVWAGDADLITCQLHAEIKKRPVMYKLVFKAESNNLSIDKELLVNGIKVISVQNGKGKVWDEDGKNETTYTSNKLALRSAGDYGDKPITRALTEFIQRWDFYDFRPDYMLTSRPTSSSITKDSRESLKLGSYGSGVPEILLDWHKNMPDNFQHIAESLAACINIRVDYREIDGEDQLCLLEGYKNPLPLAAASDGTLRFLAYHTLLNQPELPPLIAIEEPERSLHPGALKNIANVLEQLAERTQVVITTHSSQLLDAFTSESLSDWLGVLLLRNRPGLGTEVMNLEEIRDKREALEGWIADFGIGSAIFDSELLQDLMEEPVC